MKVKRQLNATGLVLQLLMVILMLSISALTIEAAEIPVETLKVGCSFPFNNPIGVEAKKCTEAYIPLFNQGGGLVIQGKRYNIEPIIYDDKYTADGGRAAGERLIYQDRVKHIIATGSAPTSGIIPIADKEKIFLLSGALTDRVIAPELKYTFRTSRAGLSSTILYSFIAKNYPNLKNFAILVPDDEGGHAYARQVTSVTQALGMKIAGALYWPRATTDFSPIAAKVLALKPDAVDYGPTAGASDLAIFLKAIVQTGYKGKHVSVQTISLSALLQLTSKDNLEGVICKVPTAGGPRPTKAGIALKEAYKAKYGVDTDYTAWDFVTAWWVFFAAAQKANSLDGDALAAAMTGLTGDGPDGAFEMIPRLDLGTTRSAEICMETWGGEVINGELVYKGVISSAELKAAVKKVYGETKK